MEIDCNLKTLAISARLKKSILIGSLSLISIPKERLCLPLNVQRQCFHG